MPSLLDSCRWLCLGGLAALLAGGAAGAAPAAPYPEELLAIHELELEDPRAALARGREVVDDPERAFWRALGRASVNTLLEHSSAAQRDVDSARATLARLPAATPRHHLWLEAYAIGAAYRTADVGALLQRNVELRRAALPLRDVHLLCEVSAADMFLLRDTNALDEAWIAAEEAERCGRELALPHLETAALIGLGGLAGDLGGKAPTESYFERALAVLGPRSARFQRAWIEWELGNAFRRQNRAEAAARYFEAALARSREIGDTSSETIVTLDLAGLQLAQGDAARALSLVREVMPNLEAAESPVRMATALRLTIEALTRLRRPGVLAEIERARALDAYPVPAHERTALARAVAAAYAAQGMHAQAYAELLRVTQSIDQGQQSMRDAQVLRLQARYEIARREAEVADLRHRAEAARLELAARDAQQRALWAALVVLAGVAGLALWAVLRVLRRRRHLAELAMRDELTGMPNRRAVLAFGQEQFRLCRRLGLPLSVALVDLDHFKTVNDRYGHAVGDRVLTTFAACARGVLRGQDRIGRYGGDEWLLVMPGAGPAQIEQAFERLRNALAAQAIDGLPEPGRVTLSMGAAGLVQEVDSLDALIEEADRQLYRAKAEGRNTLRQPAGGPGTGAEGDVSAPLPLPASA
ncbi:MAG: GGDEF domain-containing protein [Piscinibacter sp.]|nr:GGDEF domain-containing protein [Piscinibacter sp.]